MDKILVFGHKSPDTDSICSSLVKVILENKKGNSNYISGRLGELNKETEFALNYIGINKPELINDISENQNVVLVDHNEFGQSVNGIENAKITEVIDHHRISDFKTAEPLYYTAKPYGCTCTILYEMFKVDNINIDKTEAFLMASAIISDTLLLKSPTTTQKDIDALTELGKIASIDINSYGVEMLKAGTDLSDFSPEELLTIDDKYIEINGLKTKVAQVNTVDIEDVYKSQLDIEKAINDTIKNENLDLFMFVVTDIMNNNSDALVLGSKANIVEKAFNVKLENNRAFLPGVVSRKKQILPVLQANA